MPPSTRKLILAAALASASLSVGARSEPAGELRSCQTDAMIVFDASGSMGATDYTLKVPRIAHVKQSMARVLPEVAPVRRLGLIVYGQGAYNDCTSIELRTRPMPNAAARLLSMIQDIDPRGRTPLTESVRLAAEVLDYTERSSVVVLLTDGEETCGGDPCKMAAALKAAGPGLTIHVVGYRSEEGTYFKARCMADETGGKYFSVSTEDELVDALRKTLGCPFLTERRDSNTVKVSARSGTFLSGHRTNLCMRKLQWESDNVIQVSDVLHDGICDRVLDTGASGKPSDAR